VAAGAMAALSATPALARDRDHDGIGAGEVIAGALIIGGIAAVAASAGKNRSDYRHGGDYRYDRAGYRDGYRGGHGYGMNPRQVVEMCVRAAERNASRYSYGNADVTDTRSVRETRRGYEVRGRIAVNTRNAHWRNGWRGDYRGWNRGLSGYDSGSFRCKVEYGRIADIDYSGIRGLG